MTGRWTYRVSAAGVLVLAAAAFTLSYDALHQLALDSRVRPALAWLWPVVIDGTIVVALLTVLAAKRAATRAGYPWALAGLFSAASVAFNIAHAPDRPVAQLVFAMAPVALVLTTHLLMQQAGWRRRALARLYPMPVHQAGTGTRTPAQVGRPPRTRAGKRRIEAHTRARSSRVRAAYEAQLAAGQTTDRRRPGPSRRRKRAVRATPARRVHRRPDPQPRTPTATAGRRPAPIPPRFARAR